MTEPGSQAATRFRARSIQGSAQADKLLLRTSPGEDWLALEGSARRIWELLEYPLDPAELAASLEAEFEAPAGVIASAVDAALELLAGHGLVEPADGRPENPVRDLYLGLLKRAVVNLLYPELELAIDFLEAGADGLAGLDLERALRDIRTRRAGAFDALLAAKQRGESLRHAHTMIGLYRLHNLERCAERIFAEGIEGDFLEAGVCRGGAAIFMRGLQVAYGEGARRLWAVDSFEGVPPSVGDEDRRYGFNLEEERQPWIKCDLASVREHFRRYGLLGPQVHFVPGWLQETLPAAPIGPLALLRIDVDLYSATADCLHLLYDKVVPGGFVVVDDYGYLKCCRDAVDAFRERRAVAEPIEWIDRSGIFWRKAGPGQ